VTDDEPFDQWSVVVLPGEGLLGEPQWQVTQLPPATGDRLEDVVAAVRGQVPGAFALVDVADEYFVAVRNVSGRVRFLLSDVSASAEWDLAAEVMDRLDLDVPEGDAVDDVCPVGDLGMFEDLGLASLELSGLLSDLDAYADEMLSALAQRLGFAEAYERAVEALV
jgi:putative tRNA adenosine deaminase-associated protein